MIDELMTLDEAGRRLGGLSRATVERHIRAGRLRAVKLGHLTRVRHSDLAAFLDALPPVEYRRTPDQRRAA